MLEPAADKCPMADTYAFRTIRIAPRAWPQVTVAVRDRTAKAMQAAGGQLWGLFTPLIGMRSDTGILISVWPDRTGAQARADAALGGISEILGCDGEEIVPTVRPKAATPPSAAGVYSFRWFELRDADVPELIQLSSSAWETFERTFASDILGFWRSTATPSPAARVLLLTRYPDHATWDRSRIDVPVPGDPSSAALFLRRRELIESTIVTTTRLAIPG
jgi:hypothetical protein